MNKTVIIALSIVMIFSGARSPIEAYPSCPVTERTPISNPNFQLTWVRSGIKVRPNQFDILMQGIASKVFVVTQKDSEYGASKLLAIDTESGNILWHRDVDVLASIIIGGNQLYVTSYDKIEVIDPQTGTLLKSIDVPKVGFIYYLSATSDNLYAHTKSGQSLTYNMNDGTYSHSIMDYTPLHEEEGILYLYRFGEFVALEVATQSVRWTHSIKEDFDPLLFTDNFIIVKTQMGTVYGLDKKTGNQLWSVDANAISNVVTSKSKLYFLTRDDMTVLDLDKGQEIARVEYAPSFELPPPTGGNPIIGAYNIWVDAEKDMLTVSLGDSCQLIGFKLESP